VNSKQLEIFVRVAELGSLSKAAVAFGRVQPVLSRKIRELEADIGVALFHRTGRGLVLTEHGKLLYSRATIILHELREAEREVRDVGLTHPTHAIIAMPTTMGRLIIKPLVRAIHDRYPDVRLRIREGTSGPILDWISTHRVDIAILYNTMPAPQASTEPICEETMYLVGRTCDAPLPPVTDVADLRDRPLILPGRTEALRILCETAATESGFSLNVPIEADTFTAIRQLIDAGYGYGILPLPAVQLEIQQGLYQVSRLVNPSLTRQLVITTCNDRIPAAALASLVNLVKSVVIEVTEACNAAADVPPRQSVRVRRLR
jgi:LysR family nitrogen assimilation transcriptional regulator